MYLRAIVDLCRCAQSKRIAGSDLLLKLKNSSEVIALVEALESNNRHLTIKVHGTETTKSLSKIPDKTSIEIIVHGMVSSKNVVVNKLEDLLVYNGGIFLGAQPENYFLIRENFASWEESKPSNAQAYDRIIRIINQLKQIADTVNEKSQTTGQAIFLSGRKIIIDFTYTGDTLRKAPPSEDIDKLTSEIFNEHHKDARIDIFKRVLVRFLDRETEAERLTILISRIKELREAFLADLDIYTSGFSFDKAREEFERKRLDFITKISSASSDIMNKLIAIPIAQGLLASQIKTEIEAHPANWAILIGSMIFMTIAFILIMCQSNTIGQIKHELNLEKNLLKERARPTFELLKKTISNLESRIRIYRYWIPILLFLLLIISTGINIIIFEKSMPGELEKTGITFHKEIFPM